MGNNWIKYTSSKQMIYIFTVWLMSVVLMVTSITYLFTKSIFQKEYIVMYALIVASTFTIFTAFINFRKTKTE